MKKILSVLTVLIISVNLFGQYDPRENFYDAEFFLAEEDYEEALFAFKKVWDEGYEDNANINYRIGVCLLNIEGRKTEAIPYLEKAVKNITERYRVGNFKEEGAPADAWLYLGNAYRINYDHELACNAYKEYMDYLNDPDVENPATLYTTLQVDACQRSHDALSDPVEYETGTLGQLNEINASIFNAVVSGDMSTLAFMGEQRFYDAVYVSKKIDGKWMKPVNITPQIQSDGNQLVVGLSHDGNQLLLAWSDEFDSEIWISEYQDGYWSVSKPIGKPVNSKYFEAHAAFSPDGNTLYFSSNPKETIGEMDIFKSVKNPDGSWGEKENLGEKINTRLNEDAPWVSPDGKRLYFSSQGHDTYGGYDIFYSEINEDGSFGDPVNLGYPLNTSDDDFAYIPKEISYDSYLTLYAKAEESQVDLFRFELIPEFAEPVAVAFQEQEVVEEEVVEEIVEGVEDIVEEIVEEAKEVKEEKYLIKPIFFAFDSYKIDKTAASKLDDLAIILEKFPTVTLEVIGHTDAVGTMDYNQLLSEKRAKAVIKYLADKGVATEQLSLKGMSEKQPVAINRTADNHDAPEGRQLNRRVEFSVKVAGGVLIEIEDIEVPDHLKVK